MAFLHRHTGVGPALLHQFQRSQVVRSVAGQYLHGGDQLGVGIHDDGRLVSVEPSTAALVAMAHLRVMHRHHPVPAHPVPEAHSVISPFHVPRSGPGAGSGAATAPAVPPPPQSAGAPHRPPATLPAPAATTPATGRRRLTISASRACPRPFVAPVDGGFSLHAGAQVSLIFPGLGPFPDRSLLHRRQRPQQFDYPVGQQIIRVLHRATGPGCWSCPTPPSCSRLFR